MFSRERCSRFSQKESSYKCENCAYGTKKKSNFLRHLTSLRHGYLRLDKGENTVDKYIGLQDDAHFDLQQDAFGDDADHYFNDDDEPEQEQDNNIFYGECADAEAGGVESNSETEWFPFISKLHFLLSILYSSKTHRVSDEVMTFFLFILKECGTQNVPSLCKVKGCLQEKFDIGEMIQKHEDMNGNISWTIKPSAMLQLQLANPETAKRISRYPTVESSSQTIHQASGDKWRSMEFHWAINRGGQQFLKGQFISFSLRGQTIYGKIMQFLENLLEDRIYVKVSLYLDNTHTALTDEHVENNCFVKMNKYHTVLLDDCIIFDASSIRSFKENSNGELIYLSNVMTYQPISQYAEDCFEKNHKAVRSSIAHQNGHARSRDTAIQFINNELMAHVIARGFMPDSDNWRCASENVMTYKKSRKILNFLGMNINEDGDRESIPRLKNMVHKSIGSDDLMRYELQILQSIITCRGDPSLLGSNKIKVKEFKSCSTKQGETAKVDSFALYRLEEDDTDNIGQIEKLIQIGWKGENHQVVFLRRAKLIPSKQITTFQELQLESRIDVVKCKNIIQNVHCVHDCKGGKCILKEGPLPTRIEQEVQNVACKFIKHSSIHNVFIVNKCRISHATDKFLLQ